MRCYQCGLYRRNTDDKLRDLERLAKTSTTDEDWNNYANALGSAGRIREMNQIRYWVRYHPQRGPAIYRPVDGGAPYPSTIEVRRAGWSERDQITTLNRVGYTIKIVYPAQGGVGATGPMSIENEELTKDLRDAARSIARPEFQGRAVEWALYTWSLYLSTDYTNIPAAMEQRDQMLESFNEVLSSHEIPDYEIYVFWDNGTKYDIEG